ncbi:MAG TPA: YciI family protein [Patescibacteria group bacterium]|nr:YciI family protein [Patescibacteria group bacterium]
MKNFIYIYHSDRTTPPPEESLKAWGEWFATLGEHVVDGGNPTAFGSKAVLKDGKVSKESDTVVGYSIIKAADLDEAVALTQNNPLSNAPGCEVRVYELGSM